MSPARLAAAFLVALASACAGTQEPGAPAEDTPALSIESHVAGDAGFRAASHLILGRRDALLVDAQFTRSEARAVAAMVRRSGRALRTIFVTHAHPDHLLGLEILTREFPGAEVLATPEVIEEVRATAAARIAFWKPKYGDDLAPDFVTPTAFTGERLELEGAEIRVVRLGPGESGHAAVVYVPSLRALITGDLVFHGVHLWLVDNDADGWLANLSSVREVGPIDRVYPGHGPAGDASLLDANAAYIRAMLAATQGSTDAAAAAKTVKDRYPTWALPIIAELSTASRLPGKSP